MNIKGQQILNPRKLKAARFAARFGGHFKPAINANAPINKRSIRKILVQENQCIGDVLMLEPTLAALKKAFPNAEIHLLCVPAVVSLAKKAKLADKILEYSKDNEKDHIYDLVFDFHGDVRRIKSLMNFESKFYAGFSFSGGAKWLTHVVDYPFDEHQVDRPFELLSRMNIPNERKVPELKGFKDHIKQDRILLHPGANHEARRWPMENWTELITLLKEDRREVLWITPPGEEAPANIDIFDGDLLEMAELICKSSLLVGCDSMSVHLAVALNVPALAIFGSQDPELTKPYGPNGHFIIPEKECHHRKRDWRLCKECMKSVKAVEVFSQINSIFPKK